MRTDWLYGLPVADLDAQEEWVAERLTADPGAAAISADEAEAFMALSSVLRELNHNGMSQLIQAWGIQVSLTGDKGMRHAVTMLLRRWRTPQQREWLRQVVLGARPKRYPDPTDQGAAWTDDLFADGFRTGLNLMWMVQLRRHLGPLDDLEAWLAGLGENAPRLYHVMLGAGRLLLRRLIYPAAPDQTIAAAAQPALVEDLREKDRLSGSLRQNVRRLERDRKHLRHQARRAELEARALVSQARGEVAAARKALHELQSAQQRALHEQARQFEAQEQQLRDQIAAARANFQRTLADSKACPRRNVLADRAITVAGREHDRSFHQLLVESLGGTLLPAGGDVVIDAPDTLAAFERQLWSVALQRGLIKCDGLHRRKEGRPGIAISGFQVRLGSEVIHGKSSVVCCGPVSGSLMAEYGAVAMALSWLLAAGPAPGTAVDVWIDCRPLVRRLHMRRPPRRKVGCVQLDTTVRSLLRRLRAQGCTVRFRWVPRAEVHTVDRLCYAVYRDQRWYHRPQSRSGARLKDFLRAIGP